MIRFTRMALGMSALAFSATLLVSCADEAANMRTRELGNADERYYFKHRYVWVVESEALAVHGCSPCSDKS